VSRHTRGRCLPPPPQVWINSPSTANTIIVANVLARSEFLSGAQAQALVSNLLSQKQ
jgi:hypothetical protein